LEADLGRGLFDEIALRRGLGLTPVEQRQRDELRTRRTALEARVLALVSQGRALDNDDRLHPKAAYRMRVQGLLRRRRTR
jgi:hypothetical protein